jgi:hypothetical protein
LKTTFAGVHSRYSYYEALPELLTSLAGVAAQAGTEAMTHTLTRTTMSRSAPPPPTPPKEKEQNKEEVGGEKQED